MDILRTVAMFRLVMRRASIRLCGGREAALRDLQSVALLAGADGLMLGNYLTTRGRPPEEDLQMIVDAGLRPSHMPHNPFKVECLNGSR